jgi:hypothetical protein
MADRALVELNPDRTDVHSVCADSMPEFLDLFFIAFAIIARPGARSPMGIDIGITSCTSVVVVRYKIRVDAALASAGSFISAGDSLHESERELPLVVGFGSEGGTVGSMDDGQRRGNEAAEDDWREAEHCEAMLWGGVFISARLLYFSYLKTTPFLGTLEV